MKLITWNNGGLSSFGEGYKSRLISDVEMNDTIAFAKEDLQDKLGHEHKPVINIYDVIHINTIKVEIAN